ncbi:MAG: glutamate synthase, partial [Clostridia bacterium]|nr:glutamate synthase [Clostridia bacterium]
WVGLWAAGGGGEAARGGGRRSWVDPHLALAAVDRALRNAFEAGESLRRRVSIVVRAGAFRNLHDIALAVGLGADAVNPHLMLEAAAGFGPTPAQGIANLCASLQKGLEKVISTIGIHELRGYGRQFSSIGLAPSVAAVFGVENYCGSEAAGLTWERLDADAAERGRVARGEGDGKLARTFRIYAKVWKPAGDVAQGRLPYDVFARKLADIEGESPVSLRHVLDLRPEPGSRPLSPMEVDVSVGEHSYPLVISSMSFGSQGEVAFRAYAEAAKRLNIIAMNGEGGEIRDMIGRYYGNRGVQIASGRFGVSSELINTSNLVEIKIGQGAKPGEGGHLPGRKVSVKVAAARNAQPGIDLISPSNNHDIYSIEDLAQLVDELKTVNPDARVAVKVPVVPGIGVIAVGIAKAGADIITLSGFDGGTGAARVHALKYVGLPAEIGVVETHRALMEAGIRDRVEIWCDGGLKGGLDAVKMILLGANRVGYGTMAMVAVGCTACRSCQTDTCHVGIATQVESVEEARERGIKHFVPRELEDATERLCRFFRAVGEEVRSITAQLGFRRTQDMVGRVDLLQQVRCLDRVDAAQLLQPAVAYEAAAVAVAAAAGEAVRVAVAGLSSGEAGGARPAPLRPLTNQRSAHLAELARERFQGGEHRFRYVDTGVTAADRFLGTYLSGDVTRARLRGRLSGDEQASVEFNHSAVAGNGFAAFNVRGVEVRVHGGAQDGVGKTALGGRVVV